MPKLTKLLVCVTSLISILALDACRKTDNLQKANESHALQRGEDNPLYQQIVAAMEAQQGALNSYQASKIDTLLENLSDENMIVVELDDTTDIVVCDLLDYKKQAIPEYSYVYYKAYFPVVNGEVTGGVIYTIYTDLSKEAVDSDFENIFLEESTSFTGEIEVNHLNDFFTQGIKFNNGVKDQSFAVSPFNEEGQSGIGENCTTWYLVTTTFYSDGSIDRDWEILYTLCDGCIPTGRRVSSFYADCDPNAGGGSSGNPSEEAQLESGHFDYTISLGDNGSCAATLRHEWDLLRYKGVVTAVWPFVARCTNPVDDCTNDSKACSRHLEASKHKPSHKSLPSGLGVRTTWKYHALYKFVYDDGSGVDTGYEWVDKSTNIL